MTSFSGPESSFYLVPSLMDVVCGRRPHAVSSVYLGPKSSVLAVDLRTRRSCAPAVSQAQMLGSHQEGLGRRKPSQTYQGYFCFMVQLNVHLVSRSLLTLTCFCQPCEFTRKFETMYKWFCSQMSLRLSLLLNTRHVSGTGAFIC